MPIIALASPCSGLLSMMVASVALAAQQPAFTISVETGNLLMAAVGGLLTLVFATLGFFATRTFTQIDRNQKALHEAQLRLLQRIENLSKEHYILAGEHSATHRKDGC